MMFWGSSALITIIDVGIVMATVGALATLVAYRRLLTDARSGAGASLVVLGLVIIGSFFFADLLVLRVLPAMLRDTAPLATQDLHLSYGRLVVLVGALCILLGLLVSVRQIAGLVDRHRNAVRNLATRFDHAVVGMYRAGDDGKMVDANAAVVTMLGYETKAELLALDPRTEVFLDAADHARLLTRAGGSKWVSGFETRWKRKNGAQIPVRLSGGPLSRLDEDEASLEIVIEDLSAAEQLGAQLRQAQKMEAVGQLTGGIAHDFNNLLTVIQANADSVASLTPTSQRDLHVSLEELQAAARRGAAMVRRLLSFSRRSMLTMHALDLGLLMDELVGSLRRLLSADIEIRYETDEPLPAIHADAAAVEQILMNLATNARDAMPQGGRLTIETRRARLDEAFRATRGWGDPGDYVSLVVRDSGLGMDKYTRERIFEPFFTTKPVGKGTGLGMAIIYGLVKQHRGFVDVHSDPGKGTTFRVYFPLASEQVTPRVADRVVELRGGTETILMAEDEAPIRRAAKRVLERYGYSVILAADGEEALRLFRERKDGIDLVISDVVMPKMGGPQLYEAVQRESAGAKFLFSSGYREEDVKPDIAPQPSIPFLDKPWTVTELLVNVRQVLDQETGSDE